MATAVIVTENVPGFPGPATLYRIDPPMKGTDHLILYYQPPMYGQQGQLCVVLGTPTGAVYGNDVRPQSGTYVTDNPNHFLALQLAGSYLIVEPEPEIPEDELPVQQPPAPIPDTNDEDAP